MHATHCPAQLFMDRNKNKLIQKSVILRTGIRSPLQSMVMVCLGASAPNSNPVLLITSCVVLNKSLNLSIPVSSCIKRIRLEPSSWNHCKEQIRYLEKCLAHNYYKYVNYYHYHPPLLPPPHHLNPLKAQTTVSTT